MGPGVDAILCVVRTGGASRRLPKGFAPWPTLHWYFTWWHGDGSVERIHDGLFALWRYSFVRLGLRLVERRGAAGA
ncbi:hypothetical protein KCMC57_up01290 [Kitasatospora sp. CMC57]|uniref:Insertion element IS402-like domain-containing protein n=1 Tax=Kitasatospora sp. CMC57 TaxID=3231513 RepID=A0AB33JR44_9ACTN